MKSDQLPTTVSQWHEMIATQAATTTDEVVAALDRFGVTPQPFLPRSRAVNINSIRMQGTKQSMDSPGPFSFEWAGLGAGLWALLSDGNSKGKSSILLAARAALQGRFPGRIKRDVWSWIGTFRVDFTIERTAYSLTLEKDPGETEPENGLARLVRGNGASEVILYSGSAGAELEEAVGDLFMEELGFQRFKAYRSDSGAISAHGWPAMSSALFITGPGKAVFGDNLEDALPLRLMQLFIGLPWVSTYTAISSALKKTKDASEKRSRTHSEAESHNAARIGELEQQLSAKKAELAGLPDRIALRANLNRLDAEAASARAAITTWNERKDDWQKRGDDAIAIYNEARRLLQQAKDEAAAGYVFRKLKPVCCPACETGFKPGRFEATDATVCGLCGSDAPPSDDNDSVDLSAMETAVKDADVARKEASAALVKASRNLANAETSLRQTQVKTSTIERTLSTPDPSDDIVREIASTEGRLAELRQLAEADRPERDAGGDDEGPVIVVLEKAHKLTKAMMEQFQSAIMKEVEEETFSFARRLGVANLESLSFTTSRMKLSQGGVEIAFTGLNRGENLRMRIAASLATLKVARARGHGRHPGLLILDSPAAQEMSEEDFSHLARAVASIVLEIDGVQVIIGAVKRSELDAVVDRGHVREAVKDATLF